MVGAAKLQRRTLEFGISDPKGFGGWILIAVAANLFTAFPEASLICLIRVGRPQVRFFSLEMFLAEPKNSTLKILLL